MLCHPTTYFNFRRATSIINRRSISIYSSVLQYVAMCCGVLCCSVSQYAVTPCHVLYLPRGVEKSKVANISIYCSVLQYVAVYCSILQCAVLHDAVSPCHLPLLPRGVEQGTWAEYIYIFQHVAVCCSMLQCVAACCNASVASCLQSEVICHCAFAIYACVEHIAPSHNTPLNTLQQTATQCNMLQ